MFQRLTTKANVPYVAETKFHRLKTHTIRRIFKRDNGSTFPECAECDKEFVYGDQYFHCLTHPIRIREYPAYQKLCVECSAKFLNGIAKNQLEADSIMQLITLRG